MYDMGIETELCRLQKLKRLFCRFSSSTPGRL